MVFAGSSLLSGWPSTQEELGKMLDGASVCDNPTSDLIPIGYGVGMRLCSLILISLLATCSVGLSQTQSQLGAKFGHPDNKGYIVSPDVRLTVTYGRDQQACRLELRSKAQIGKNDEQEGFKPEIADRVLNDIAPEAMRTGTPRTMLQQMGCPAMATEKYSNVSIMRSMNECKGTVEALVIQWTRPACGAVRR